MAASAAAKGETIMPVPLAAGSKWCVLARGTAFNSYHRVLRPLERANGIQVRAGAHVTRLVWDAARGRVSGVDYVDRLTARGGHVEAAAVVLAAGPINTPRILLSSTSNTFPSGLGNQAGLVGAYLHDHPHHGFELELRRPLTRLGHIAYLARAPYDSSKPLSAAQCTLGARGSLSERALSALPLKSTRLGVIVFGTMRPTMHNRVSLSVSEVDGFGLPVPDIKIAFAQSDVRSAHDGESRLVELLDAFGLAPTLKWRVQTPVPGSSVHYAGTARMHSSSEFGVVDGLGALHHCPNVVVADASVFTTCVEKNPTLTAMALSARAADALAPRLMSRRRNLRS